MDLEMIGKQAKEVEHAAAKLSTQQKNDALQKIAADLQEHAKEIIAANQLDFETGKKNQMSAGLLDRLLLTEERIGQMALGLRQIADLEDPIGSVEYMKKRPNGLKIGRVRVSLGVIGIIYESRPNVTADAFGLCFKTGNVVILKGGSDAIHSNKAIVDCIRTSLKSCNIPENLIQLIEATDRDTATAFMKLNDYVDVLIPRGGAGLIRAVVKNATIPVIETGTGNCHVYVDESADFNMAIDIIFNAKTQRIGVCNACESIVLHEKIVDDFMPLLAKRLKEKAVEIRGDQEVLAAVEVAKKEQKETEFCTVTEASEEDWGTEYLDYILSAKTVSGVEEAIEHINRYNTGHSEAIITENYSNAEKFLNEVDAACVYVNASTRFTDGFEFGFGAEIGISTQKLHARGPMGLEALTSTKYVIYGNGQVRK